MTEPTRKQLLEYALRGAERELETCEWSGYDFDLSILKSHIEWLETELKKEIAK